jgi:cytochrome o ubiquinol oxidase subunit IV
MSAHASEAHGAHGHDAHGHDEHGHGDGGAAHGSLKGYLTGFVLSVILTAIPFWLVMGNVIDSATGTAVAIMGLGVVQIIVHMIYFLHMNSRSEGGWTMLALIFTLILVAITLSGSLWVMYHLNVNMMPGMSPEMMREMP